MKISVITAVYNNRDTVADAIDSVLAQTHAEVELIVIDGASTDGTLDVLRAYGNKLNKLVSEPDGGIYDALNKGLLHASGDVVGFLHSDDVFADAEVLAKVAKAFSNLKIEAVYGDLVYVRKDMPDKVVRYWSAGEFAFDKLRRGWMPPHPTLYVKRALYEQIGVFDTQYRIAADYDFMLRLLSIEGIGVAYVPELFVKMRLGGESNRSLKNLLWKSHEDYIVMRRNKVGGLLTLLFKNLRKLPQFLGRT